MQWKITVAARPQSYKIGEMIPLLLAGLPWAETLALISPAALLWAQVTDPHAVAEPKPAARILRQVMPLCREDEEFTRENSTVAEDLAGLVYGRGFGMLPYAQRLDIQMEVRRFAAKAGEVLTGLLGNENCACLRTMLQSGILHPEHFLHDLHGDEDYPAEWARTLLTKKSKDAPVMLMRRDDISFWTESGWQFVPTGQTLPAWAEKTPEELLILQKSFSDCFDACSRAVTALQKAGAEDAAARQMLTEALRPLAESKKQAAEHALSVQLMQRAGEAPRLALVLE